MWPSQDSPPHAASLNTDESSPAGPPASREGGTRPGVGLPWTMDMFQYKDKNARGT